MTERTKTTVTAATVIIFLVGVSGTIWKVASEADDRIEKKVTSALAPYDTKLAEDRKDIDRNERIGEGIAARLVPIEKKIEITQNDIAYIKEDISEIKRVVNQLAERRSE